MNKIITKKQALKLIDRIADKTLSHPVRIGDVLRLVKHIPEGDPRAWQNEINLIAYWGYNNLNKSLQEILQESSFKFHVARGETSRWAIYKGDEQVSEHSTKYLATDALEKLNSDGYLTESAGELFTFLNETL